MNTWGLSQQKLSSSEETRQVQSLEHQLEELGGQSRGLRDGRRKRKVETQHIWWRVEKSVKTMIHVRPALGLRGNRRVECSHRTGQDWKRDWGANICTRTDEHGPTNAGHAPGTPEMLQGLKTFLECLLGNCFQNPHVSRSKKPPCLRLSHL